jgi:putative PIN family toxin of toxin-antitoxin system
MLIVLDTNILVSALLKRNSNPGRILDLIISNQVQVALDSRILKEYVNVLARPRLGVLPSSA